MSICRNQHTDGNKTLHTLLVKHYNDLLDRQSSEWGRDEVTYFYVEEVFGIQGVSRHSGKSNISLTERKTQVRFYLMIDLLSI